MRGACTSFVRLCKTRSAVYDGVHHTSPPLGRFFQARLLDNQEGANSERYVVGKLSRRDVSKADLVGTGDTVPPAVEISTMEDRPRGCEDVIYPVVH